jgi:hypothetical protein
MPIEPYRNKFIKMKIARYLYFGFTLYSDAVYSSIRFTIESTNLDSTRIIINYFLDRDSILIAKAEINPAIGAFILSFVKPSRLSRQSTNLYADENTLANIPNFPASR